MNKEQARELVATLEETCSATTQSRMRLMLDHLKQMEDREIYPVMMTLLSYSFKRNRTLLGNLLMLGFKLIDESAKGDHELVVKNFYDKFSKIFKEGPVN